MSKSLNFLRLPQVVAKTGMPPSSIYEMVAAGKFPKQVAVSAQRRAWIEEEVDAWMHEIIAKRDQHAA